MNTKRMLQKKKTLHFFINIKYWHICRPLLCFSTLPVNTQTRSDFYVNIKSAPVWAPVSGGRSASVSSSSSLASADASGLRGGRSGGGGDTLE